MSTLEKTINLLYTLPEPSLEIIYDFIKSLQTPENRSESDTPRQKMIDNAANSLINENMKAFIELAK